MNQIHDECIIHIWLFQIHCWHDVSHLVPSKDWFQRFRLHVPKLKRRRFQHHHYELIILLPFFASGTSSYALVSSFHFPNPESFVSAPDPGLLCHVVFYSVIWGGKMIVNRLSDLTLISRPPIISLNFSHLKFS